MESKMVKHKHKTGKKHILDISNLKVSYGKTEVLKDVSLKLKENTFLAVLGKNGSGKTTLIKAILNFIKHTGDISIYEEDISKMKRREISKKIAYVPQYIDKLEDVRVYDYISFGRFPYSSSFSLTKADKKIIDKTMSFLRITELKNKFVSELSGGQRQKVSIASALVQETEIIILDEPTTYLDIYNQYEILEILHKLHTDGKTVIAILHEMNHAFKYADEALILNKGKIYAHGSPEKVINEKALKDAFDVNPTFKTIHKVKHLIDIDVDEIRKGLSDEI